MATTQRTERQEPPAGDHLIALGRQLERERARARQCWRRWQRLKEQGSADASLEAAQWSKAIEDALRTAEMISREPAHDLAGLSTKFEALRWWSVQDNSILDAALMRWLARYGRELRRVARAR